MPPSKRIRLSKQKEPSTEPEFDDEESEDEWAQERAARGGADEGDSDDGEDEVGVAQFEDDEGEDQMDEDEDEETVIGKQLSAIPFSSLLKAKRKLTRAAKTSDSEESDDEDVSGAALGRRVKSGEGAGGLKQTKRKNGSLRKADRASKHAPMEMSSKRAVGRTRQIVETTANKARDPRFDSLSGSFKPDLFRNSYSFLAAAQTAELEALRKTATAARRNAALPEEDKEKIEAALVRMESREVTRKNKERDEGALKGWKKEEAGKREAGKKEFYLKKSDQKAILLKAKFDTLAVDKKLLRKAVEKRRRKTVQSDKKNMPAKRAV